MTNSIPIPIYSPESLPRAAELVDKYGFTLCTDIPEQPYMLCDESGLSFIDPINHKEKLQVDFLTGRTGYRLTSMQGTAQPLLKALGFSKKSEAHLRVFDATAGLGADSMLLAIAGCHVTMLERNYGMLALLEDGLKRALYDEQFFREIISTRISVVQADSINYLRNEKISADAIYLDPMFPQRKKSALVKKEMRLAKLLAGEDEDADKLVEAALTSGLRVVVKRPTKAEPLAAERVVRQIAGKSIRFDLYNC